jgi:transcriptional regulator with XRE-family HTH domain
MSRIATNAGFTEMLDFVTKSLIMVGAGDDTSAEAIGRRLKALRLGYGLTQEALTALLGYVSKRGATWNRFETGAQRFTMDGYERLLTRFPVPYSWVFHGQMGDLSSVMRDRITAGMRKIEKRERTKDG